MPSQSQGAKRRIDSSSTPRATNPTGKRSRVSRACDQCRTAREKCDGKPICSTCAASKRACTYTANPKKRGIQPGYIRTLELALTWLFNNSDVESILNKKLSQEGASSVLLERDTKESNKLHRSWRRTKFCRDVDKLLSGEDITEEDHRDPDSDEQESETEDLPRQSTAAPSLIDHTPSAREPAAAFTHNNRRSNQVREGEIMQLPQDRWRLFDVYFAYTHCWFPICEKHDILKLSYSYPEGGLQLSPNMPTSGDHAELWSILALASLQDTSSEDTSTSLDLSNSFTAGRIYDIARTLIPDEFGAFELGHVKSLLLLALFNVSQSCPEAAWLLVGHASRIVTALEQKNLSQVPRFKHVFSGCFFLDHLISMQLGREPYLKASDIERIGKVYEDGLEEWQPWTGHSGSMPTSSQPRAPTLSLSTFNRLIDVTGIMGLIEFVRPPQLEEAVGRLDAWKVSLPPTFEHVLSDRLMLPSAPPALLIQVVYHCCCVAIFSSQSWIQRMLDVLERCQNNLGWCALPPVINCLLDIAEKHANSSTTHGGIKERLQYYRTELTRAWSQKGKAASHAHQASPVMERRTQYEEPTNAFSRRSFGSHQQVATPESIQMPTNHLEASSTLMNDAVPGLGSALMDHQPQPLVFNNISHSHDFQAAPFDNSIGPLVTDQWNTTGSASRNVESFFDELASLDGAERVENQPQFMQNLGFAPDADMADLLTSDFGQLTSMLPQFVQQGYHESNRMNEGQFFGGG